MTTATTPVRAYTQVTYHGSIGDVHGPATCMGPCPCGGCWEHEQRTGETRYELRLPNRETLRHTARASFTVAPVTDDSTPLTP